MIVKKWLLVAVAIVCMTIPIVASTAQANQGFQTRCGWYENPTPGNFSLTDRDAMWIIGEQGRHHVSGDVPYPNFDSQPNQWVATNGSYGYGCACFKMKVNSNTRKVIAIQSSQVKPLKACRQDRAISNKEPA